MPSRYQRSWDDPAIQGLDVALKELDGLAGLEEDVKPLIREVTEDAQRDAIARWDQSQKGTQPRTGRYREAIRKVFFDDADGFKGSVFVAPMDDPRRRGWRAVNLPLWLEYGTRYMSARPHLIPAFELARRKLDRLVEQLLHARAS